MKQLIFLLFIGLFVVVSVSAQKNEYHYAAIRIGGSFGFSGQPEMNVNKYLLAPGYGDVNNVEMQLTPLSSYSGFTPGITASFLYHFDFTGDMAGIFTGLDYNYNGITSKYETAERGFDLKETHRMHMIGIPLAIKYGPDIWNTQRYIYAGVELNFIASMSAVQKVNWNPTPSSTKLTGEEYKKTAFSIFFGVNWKVVNFQFDFYPQSVFESTYKEDGYLKYEGQVAQFFAFRTSINVPYGWLSDKSFWWRRKLRKFPLWK